MPEPERKIEKLLRASAKRRRVDAGEPFQMHPVTRNLLQREVAKRAKTTPQKESFLARIFSIPRPRLVFATSVLAVLALAAALLVPSVRVLKQPSTMAKVANGGDALAVAHPASEAPAKREVAADKAEGMRAKLYYGVAPQTATPPPVATPAAPLLAGGVSPEQAKAASGEGKFLAGSSTVTALGGDGYALAKPVESLLKQTFQDEVAVNELKTPSDRLTRYAAEGVKEKIAAVTNGFALADVSALGAPVAAKPASGTGGFSNLGNFAQVDADDLSARQTHGGRGGGGNLSTSGAVNFAQTTDAFRFENRKDSSGKDAANRTVLASFQIVQNGDDVQVIDGDGSVYSGHFYSPETDRAWAFYKTADEEKKLSEPKVAEEEISRRAKTPALVATRSFQSMALAPLQSFQVTGTNRTLNAVVVLNGRFLAETNLAVAGTNSFDLAFRKVDLVAQTNAAPVSGAAVLNSRISGTARVGGKEIPIEARRVAP